MPDANTKSHRITTQFGQFYAVGPIKYSLDRGISFVNEATGKHICVVGTCLIEPGVLSPAAEQRQLTELRQQAQVRLLQSVAADLGMMLPQLASYGAERVARIVDAFTDKGRPAVEDIESLFNRPEFDVQPAEDNAEPGPPIEFNGQTFRYPTAQTGFFTTSK